MITAVLLASQNPGYSEFLLDGTRDHLVIKADRMPLNDIVGEIGKKFNVRLKSPLAPDIRVDGRFSGSLTYVIRRLFQSYNFVLAVGQDGDSDSMVIIVLGQRSNSAGNWATASFQPPTEPRQVRGQGGM